MFADRPAAQVATGPVITFLDGRHDGAVVELWRRCPGGRGGRSEWTLKTSSASTRYFSRLQFVGALP